MDKSNKQGRRESFRFLRRKIGHQNRKESSDQNEDGANDKQKGEGSLVARILEPDEIGIGHVGDLHRVNKARQEALDSVTEEIERPFVGEENKHATPKEQNAREKEAIAEDPIDIAELRLLKQITNPEDHQRKETAYNKRNRISN